jgi:hypothetical protein
VGERHDFPFFVICHASSPPARPQRRAYLRRRFRNERKMSGYRRLVMSCEGSMNRFRWDRLF